jgi:hypothetical protein
MTECKARFCQRRKIGGLEIVMRPLVFEIGLKLAKFVVALAEN